MQADVAVQIAIVLEYMNGGSLGDILQKVRLAASFETAFMSLHEQVQE